MEIKNIAVVGGGNSGEREISLKSLDNVCRELAKTSVQVYKIIVTGSVCAYFNDATKKEVLLDLNDFSLTISGQKIKFDAVYNTIHGTPGENGFLPGYFDWLNIPYSSCSTMVSALTFNKEFCKKALKGIENIHFAQSLVVKKGETIDFQLIATKIGFPCFVKPNNGGSSVATAKAKDIDALKKAILDALTEDHEVIIEEYIEGTEITCGVARIQNKIQSIAITEIVSKLEFFDFAAKYSESSTQEITPARLTTSLYSLCMERCQYIYKFLGCKGIIRIDFIVKNDHLYFLEVNTTPGMTDRSLIPQQAAYANIPVSDMLLEALTFAINEKTN